MTGRCCALSCLGIVLFMGCGRNAADPAWRSSAVDGSANLPTSAADRSVLEAAPGDDQTSKGRGPGQGGDKFDPIVDNPFLAVADTPRSTFSLDVDTASYAKARMFLLQQQQLPPADSVRIEDFLNYFDYEYSPPAGSHPFSLHVNVTEAPWSPRHALARIAVQGRQLENRRPPCNLVLLLDVSGSMNVPNKLPLLIRSLRVLTNQLTERDRLSIVVYAGAAGMVLPPTSGEERATIVSALSQLQAGGSTNGGEGIRLAYRLAQENYVPDGVNRVLLCTDGDFNVGTTSTGDLVRLAESEAKKGVFLTILGFGMGNHNDSLLEQLSNRANGNYSFIDSDTEAQKVLGDQLNCTLVTIAKDVKVQVEFNPAEVAAYRLIGYENRRLETRDFQDDRKDAGDIGAGHQVTALYELVLADSEDADRPPTEPLKYQSSELTAHTSTNRAEWMTVKVRYKRPDADTSQLVELPVLKSQQSFAEATDDFRFAAAVAAFGMLLRGSEHRGQATYAEVLEIARSAKGQDPHGYREEFIELVRTAERITR